MTPRRIKGSPADWIRLMTQICPLSDLSIGDSVAVADGDSALVIGFIAEKPKALNDNGQKK